MSCVPSHCGRAVAVACWLLELVLTMAVGCSCSCYGMWWAGLAPGLALGHVHDCHSVLVGRALSRVYPLVLAGQGENSKIAPASPGIIR